MSDGSSRPSAPFRYCIHCSVDCEEYEPEHGPECPQTTGLWPVTEQELGMRGPNDPYAHGMRCMDCGDEFALGDFYAHRRIEDDVFEVVCVGCAALTIELKA